MRRRYKKGYSLEHSVKRFLEEKGIPVIRFPSSRPADLFFKLGKVRFIVECKNVTRREKRSIYINGGEIDKLRKVANLFDAEPILVFSFYRQRPQVALLDHLIAVGRSLRLDHGKGMPLKDFIEARSKT